MNSREFVELTLSRHDGLKVLSRHVSQYTIRIKSMANGNDGIDIELKSLYTLFFIGLLREINASSTVEDLRNSKYFKVWDDMGFVVGLDLKYLSGL